MRSFSLGATLLVALPAGARESYVGKWASDLSWCGNDPRSVASEHVAIIITSKRIDGLEYSCTFRSKKPLGKSSVQVGVICWGEGEEYRERIVMEYGGDRLVLTYPDRDNAKDVLKRCRRSTRPTTTATPFKPKQPRNDTVEPQRHEAVQVPLPPDDFTPKF